MSDFLWAKSQLGTKNTNIVFSLDVMVENDCSATFNLTANAMYSEEYILAEAEKVNYTF